MQSDSNHRPRFTTDELAAVGIIDGDGAVAESPQTETKERISYNPQSCADLIATKFEIRFLVEKILVPGNRC